MNQRYRMYRRKGGLFYCFDKSSGQRESLGTSDLNQAQQLILAKNRGQDQAAFSLQMAKACLAAASPEMPIRTWGDVFSAGVELKQAATKERWTNAPKQSAFAPLLGLRLIETRPEHFLRVLKNGTVATNVFLRRIQNLALDLGWILLPVLPKALWPKIRYKEKRAITKEEHQKILDAEKNPEWRAFLEVCWYSGASQSDVAGLNAEQINWDSRTISYCRRKTSVPVVLRIGKAFETVLRKLPEKGKLFPRLSELHEKHRAKLFNRRCRLVGIKGISLHSYRYSWAERAVAANYPERFAQLALGHSSKAVHRAYARKAQFELPPLD